MNTDEAIKKVVIIANLIKKIWLELNGRKKAHVANTKKYRMTPLLVVLVYLVLNETQSDNI